MTVSGGLAEYASIPVINALSDDEHPCQALADFMTLSETWPDLSKARLAYIGDGNNVCNSLLLLCGIIGGSMAVATPPGYGPPDRFVELAKQLGAKTGAKFLFTTDPHERRGKPGDLHRRLGQHGRERKAKSAKGFFLLQLTQAEETSGSDAIFLHCLPAHRGRKLPTR
jgi:ornithine carbamoyltransferase